MKKKFDKALKYYRESQALSPGNIPIYDKLIQAHEKTGRKWTKTDFALSLEWTMKKQELENPALKKIHERLDPDKVKAALLETLSALKKKVFPS